MSNTNNVANQKPVNTVHTAPTPSVSKDVVQKASMMDQLRRALEIAEDGTILVVDNKKKLRKFYLNFKTGEFKEMRMR